MSYSDWQADTIRRALNRYRYNAGRNGTALSLTRVHELILLSDRSPRNDALKYEVLRRFATSDHLPEAHNLNSIKGFLLEEKYLSEEELDPKTADLEEMLAIQAYLANFDKAAKLVVSEVQQNYRAALSFAGFDDTVALRTLIDKSGCFFKVEEVFQRATTTAYAFDTVWDQKEESVKLRSRRKGYGFVSTPQNLVHVFLRGADPADRVTYMQAWPNPDGGRLYMMLALRFGRETLENKNADQYKQTDGPVELDNVYRFVPQDERGVSERPLT